MGKTKKTYPKLFRPRGKSVARASGAKPADKNEADGSVRSADGAYAFPW